MASLYIKDPETAALAASLAARLRITKTQVVRDALKEKQQALSEAPRPGGAVERYLRWQNENPLPPPTDLKADKAFFDEMWGEI